MLKFYSNQDDIASKYTQRYTVRIKLPRIIFFLMSFAIHVLFMGIDFTLINQF